MNGASKGISIKYSFHHMICISFTPSIKSSPSKCTTSRSNSSTPHPNSVLPQTSYISPIISSQSKSKHKTQTSTQNQITMSSPSPTIPISNPSTTTNQSQQPSITITTATIREFFTRLTRYGRHALTDRRPWIELIDRTSFSRPDSLSEATSRIRKNFYYFRVNYLILLALVLAFSLLSHPVSLFLLVSLIAAWIQLYVLRPSDQPLVIFGRTITNFETLIGLTLITVVVVLLTSVISLLLSAATMWLGTVSAHGAFRVPEDLFLDEQEPLASGLFSFVGGPTSSAGVPTGSSLV